jgi:hypothetical protein
MKEFKITLDLIQVTKNPLIHLKTDDVDSVKFIIQVLNDGVILDLTDATSVRLAVQKPSGVDLFQDCTITDAANGMCEIILITQAYNEIGENSGELYINTGGIMQVTRRFEYKSLDSILAEGTSVGDGGGGPVYWADILSKPLTYPPSIHEHLEYLTQTEGDARYALDGEIPTHTHLWTEITGKPTTFPPETHVHNFADIANKPLSYPPDAHTHDFGAITGKPTEYPPSAHAHAITDVTGLTEALGTKLEVIPAEFVTETEGDLRYELKGEGGGGASLPKTGETEPTGVIPDYVGQVYVDTLAKEAYMANSAAGDWQSISMDELGGGAGSVDWGAVTGKPNSFPPSAHNHTTAEITGLDATLTGKSDVGHAHAWTEITAKPTEFDPIAHNHLWADITDKPATFTPAAHSHDFASITEKPLSYPPDAHTHLWAQITDKPTTFTPETHSHAMTDVTGLSIALDGKSDTGHSHDFASITTKPTTLTGYGITDAANLTDLDGKSDIGHVHDYASITGKPTTFTPSAHTHLWAEITDKPTTFTPAAHNHLWAEITDKPTTFAPAAHSHTEADVTLGGTNAKTYVDDADNFIKNTVLNGLKLWSGTQVAYDAIVTPDPTTLYFITG